MSANIEVLLSKKVLGTVLQAWKIGGAALTLLVIATTAILAAFVLALRGDKLFASAFLAFGLLLVSFVAFKIYAEGIRPALRVTNEIKSNAALLDSVQLVAVELSEIITQLNDYALMNANQIVDFVSKTKAILSPIPIANRVLELEYFRKSDEFSTGVRNVTKASKHTIKDIQEALSKSDGARIIPYVQKLENLKLLIDQELFRKNVT